MFIISGFIYGWLIASISFIMAVLGFTLLGFLIKLKYSIFVLPIITYLLVFSVPNADKKMRDANKNENQNVNSSSKESNACVTCGLSRGDVLYFPAKMKASGKCMPCYTNWKTKNP